jgi:hypothetical protein
VPLATSKVLAGHLTNGEITEVLEHSGEDNDLPPGEYLLVLSPSENYGAGSYFPTLGLPGEFRVEGGDAYAQCANLSDPAHPSAPPRGVTKIDRLVQLFSTAVAQAGQSSAAPS